jgi:hypothetical protein
MDLSDAKDQLLFKQQLKEACLSALLKRIRTAESAMQQAQESANQEDKSSAGDKYETARAMGQLDRDMNARQLAEAQKEYNAVQGIDISMLSNHVTNGSVLTLDGKLFFIGSGLGSVEVSGLPVIMLSAKSPLYEQVKGKHSGDTVLFQNKEIVISQVF